MSISAFLFATAMLRVAQLDAIAAFALALVSISVGLFWITGTKAPTAQDAVPDRELVYRMIAAAVLVLSITGASSMLGPQLSGLLAPFPIAGSVLAGFSHHSYGHEVAAGLLKGFLRGLIGMAVFDFALLTLGRWVSFELSFTAAIACGLLVGIIASGRWSMGSQAGENRSR